MYKGTIETLATYHSGRLEKCDLYFDNIKTHGTINRSTCAKSTQLVILKSFDIIGNYGSQSSRFKSPKYIRKK